MHNLLRASEMALDALLDAQQIMIAEFSDADAYADEIAALRKSLAQHFQRKPVAWRKMIGGKYHYFDHSEPFPMQDCEPLYPPDSAIK